MIPEKWRLLFALNPMVGVIDGFRWCLLKGEQKIHWDTMAISLGVSFLLLLAGIRRFRKMEKSFADLI
jgi:lipopolysaccharide transport system permease protein